ncbi:MAG: aminotransferase class V-fold PLP-dependent enzyme [Pseudomonadota bacterium]|nr:aminotransferase class V-fold PLP-dependent enzyme [Pseudomonadota bacterium]
MSTSPRLGDRSLFPDLEPRAYLAHCAISPVSAPVRAAVVDYVDSYARHGVGALGTWLEQRARLRGSLARLIGAGPEDIGLVANTTTGVIDIAFGIAWKRGDKVVVFDGEFPANVTPWQQAAETFGLEIVRLPLTGFGLPGEALDGLARLRACLRDGVRLVAVSAVQFQTGLAMPLAEIAALCRGSGAELFVDAIQAVGVVPIDVSVGIDYLACGSHKWLMGIDGCAFVYVSPERVGALVPRLGGWLSHEDPVGFLLGASPLRYDRPLRARADVFEGGAANGAGLAALGAGVEVLEALGVGAVHAHVQRWHDAIEPELGRFGLASLRSPNPGGRSGILALRLMGLGDVQRLVKALGTRGIVVSAPENNLRIAPSWPNALDEVPVVVDALDGAVREALGLS